MKKFFRVFAIIAFLGLHVGCDQISKHAARTHLTDQVVVNVIPGHLDLYKTENRGAFLGSFKHLPEPFHTLFLKVIPLLIVFVAIIWIMRASDLPIMKTVSLVAILGGGLGNLIDRIWLGSVTDFMQIKAMGWHTGIFNMADVSISLGFLLLVYCEVSAFFPGSSQKWSNE